MGKDLQHFIEVKKIQINDGERERDDLLEETKTPKMIPLSGNVKG